MWTKLFLLAMFILMVVGAFRFEPARERTLIASRTSDGPRLRLMTWNIGYADLEKDTRAHNEDLKAVAETILRHDPDAVALQELTGEDQLKILLDHLNNRYIGAVARLGNADRIEAVLVKNTNAHFDDVPCGDKFALGATFHMDHIGRDVVLISAHTDAFVAAKRRDQIENIVEWGRKHTDNSIVFIAGDLNFEVSVKKGSNLFTDDPKHDSKTYNYLLKYFRDLGRDAGDTAINDRRIDYIFAPPEIVLLRRAEVLKGVAAGHMDHWPLLVEVAV